MAEIPDDRLDELEGAEAWCDYLLRELEDLADSFDDLTIGDVHDALRSLTIRMRNGDEPEPDEAGREETG